MREKEAYAADGDAVALLEFAVQLAGADGEAAVAVLLCDTGDASDFFDDAGKHE